MDKFYFIGIDVSKKKLDICVMCDAKVLTEEQITNSTKVITQAIKHIKRELDITNDMFIICAEHTGQYTYPLICATKAIRGIRRKKRGATYRRSRILMLRL